MVPSILKEIDHDGLVIVGSSSDGIGDISVEELAYQTATGLNLTARDINLGLSYLDLLLFSVRIKTIYVGDLNVDVRKLTAQEGEKQEKPPASEDKFTLPNIPSIPLSLKIDEILFNQINIDAKDLSLKNLSLKTSAYAFLDDLVLELLISKSNENTEVTTGDLHLVTKPSIYLSYSRKTGLQVKLANQETTINTAEPYRVPDTSLYLYSDIKLTGEDKLNMKLNLLSTDLGTSCYFVTKLDFDSLIVETTKKDSQGCDFDFGRISPYLPKALLSQLGGILTLDLNKLQLPLKDFEPKKMNLNLKTKLSKLSLATQEAEIRDLNLDSLIEFEQGKIVGDIALSAGELKYDAITTNIKANFELSHYPDKRQLQSKINIPHLINLNSNLSSDHSLSNFGGNIQVSLDDLGHVWSLTKPYILEQIPIYLIPQELSGQAEIKISTERLKIDDFQNIESMLKRGKIQKDVVLKNINYFTAGNRTAIKNTSMRIKSSLDASLLSTAVSITGEKFRWTLKDKKTVNIGALEHHLNISSTLNTKKIEQSLFAVDSKSILSKLRYDSLPSLEETKLDFESDISSRKIDLKLLTLDVKDLGLKSKSTATILLDETYQTKNVEAKTKLDMSAVDIKTDELALSSSGSLSFEGHLQTDLANFARIESSQSYDKFSIAIKIPDGPSYSVAGIDGNIPIKKTVLFGPNDRKQIKRADVFRSLLYPSEETSFVGENPISIDRLSIGEITFSEIYGNVAIDDDHIYLTNLSMNTLDGTVEVNVETEFNNSLGDISLRLGFTGLNSKRLLDRLPKVKRKASSWTFGENPNLSGSLRLAINLDRNNWQGQLKITEIGKEQMKALLYYIDPYEKDRSLASIRTALRAGDISYLYVPVKDGLLALELGITIAAVPIPLPKISGLPIADIIANAKSSDQEQSINESSYEAL